MTATIPLRLLFVLACLPAWALAGPPFQTDDPEPVDFRHWEVYTFGSCDATRAGAVALGPALEVNWGAVPDVQLHLVVPASAAWLPGAPAAFGIGDTELGVKYRFVHETRHRPQVGIFPFVELATGSAAAGLGNGRTWYRLPLWMQKSAGPWTTYGGGGEVINHAPRMRNYQFAGWLLERDVRAKLTLGGEIFEHGPEGPAALSTRSSALFDFGGYYYFRKPGFQLLFMVGHSIAGQAETVAYAGLYWTGG